MNSANDRFLDEILNALKKYESHHPKAEIDAYRYNSASVYIRIVDPEFQGLSRVERDDAIWKVLDELPEDVLFHVSLVLALTPAEKSQSNASSHFDRHLPSNV